jgi:D-alanine-D-alanine ligase
MKLLLKFSFDGTEVSVGVPNYRGEVIVLPITEIVSENDFLIMKPNIWGNLKK